MSNVSYKGNVTIKVMNGKKVIKVIKSNNSGTTWLFKVLASAVIGSAESSNNMPHYLDVVNASNDDLANATSLLSNKVSFTAKRIAYDTDTEGYKAILDAFIPRRSLIDPTSSTATHMLMYSAANNNETLLASIKLKEPLILSGSNNYAVEWEMCFMNGTTEDSSVIDPAEEDTTNETSENSEQTSEQITEGD